MSRNMFPKPFTFMSHIHLAKSPQTVFVMGRQNAKGDWVSLHIQVDLTDLLLRVYTAHSIQLV